MLYSKPIDALLREARTADRQVVLRSFLTMAVACIAAGIAVRFIGIGSRSLWLDEAYSAWFVGLSWRDLWVLTPRYETHPPFYYSLLKAWTYLFGDSGAALRSLSAVAGLVAIPIMAVAAKELARLTLVFRPNVLIAGTCILMAVSPRLVIAGQDARPYALLLLAYAAALAAWLRLTRSFRNEPRSAGRIGDWILLTVATVAVLWLHALGILYATALLAALLLTASESASAERWRRLGAATAVAAVLYLPCFLMLVGRAGDWSNGWLKWQPLLFPGQLMNLYGQLKMVDPLSAVTATVATCGLLLLGIRFLWLAGDRRLAAGLTSLLLLPPILAAIISQFAAPVFLPRTMLAVSAPAYLVVSLAIAQSPKWKRLGFVFVMLLAFAINLAQTLVRPSLETWGDMAAILKRDMKPGDIIWVYPNDVALPLGRALGGDPEIQAAPAAFPALEAPGYRRSGNPGVVALDGRLARRWALQNAPPAGATIWLLTYKKGLFDPDGAVARELSAGRRLSKAYGDEDIKLQSFAPNTLASNSL
jgi:uncharacterized membrane protein